MSGGATRKAIGSRGYKKMYYEYITNARRRNYRFDLSLEEFKKIIIQPCFYCGSIPRSAGRLLSAYMDFWPPANGVDRINPNKGYTLVNSIPACKTCNQMKGSLRMQEFLDHIGRMNEKAKKNK